MDFVEIMLRLGCFEKVELAWRQRRVRLLPERRRIQQRLEGEALCSLKALDRKHSEVVQSCSVKVGVGPGTKLPALFLVEC